MSNSFSEMPPSWLSKIIKECRKIERILPFMERAAERDAIVAAIKASPEGVAFAKHKNLSEVVNAALGVANNKEREIKRNPGIMTGSPETTAASFIADELGETL